MYSINSGDIVPIAILCSGIFLIKEEDTPKAPYTVRFGTADFIGYIGKLAISGQFCPFCPILGSRFSWLYRDICYKGIGYFEV